MKLDKLFGLLYKNAFRWMRTAHSLPYGGGCLCQGGFLSRRVSDRGVSVHGEWGLCQGDHWTDPPQKERGTIETPKKGHGTRDRPHPCEQND